MARPLLDATLAAMRLSSKQQMAGDCMNGADVCDLRYGGKSSSLESLMTLSWAIKVIMKEQAQTSNISEPDAVMNFGQSFGEDLFGLREFTKVQVIGKSCTKVQIHVKSFMMDGGVTGEKSLDGHWSMALEDQHKESS